MRLLGEIRYEFEPDEDGSDEFPILEELEKNQKDFSDDMSLDYLNKRFEELGIEGNVNIRIIPSVTGLGSDISDGETIYFNDTFSIKRIEFIKVENTVYLHF